MLPSRVLAFCKVAWTDAFLSRVGSEGATEWLELGGVQGSEWYRPNPPKLLLRGIDSLHPHSDA